MYRIPAAVALVIALLTVSCGEVEKQYSRIDKLATIAMLEDSRSMGNGELLDYIKDPDTEIRMRSVIALGRMGVKSTVTNLVPLLADSVESVRLEAAFAMGQIGGSEAMLAISSKIDKEKVDAVKSAMIEALGTIGNPVAVATILGYVENPDPRIRKSCAFAFSRIADHHQTDKLIELSRDSVEDVRWMAVFAMARTGDSTALGRLQWCLKDSSSLARQYAARAIGELGDSTDLDDLTQRLQREDNDLVKINLIRSIAEIGDRRALKSLLNVLSGDDPVHVKAEAIAAIGRLKLNKAMAKVKPLFADEDRTIKDAALTTVAQIDPEFFLQNVETFLDSADRYEKTAIIEGLASIDSVSSFDFLSALFDDPSGTVRCEALSAMGDFKDIDIKPYIETGLDDPDFTVVVTAIDIIAKRKDTSFVGKIAGVYADHLADKEPDIRLAIVQEFGKWVDSTSPNPAMMEVFNRSLGDVDYLVREAGINAYLKIGIDHTSSLGKYQTGINSQNYAQLFERYESNPKAVIETNRGVIEFELLYNIAPKTVNNFINLAESGFYDKKVWHRVVPAFVIQDGCPRGDGWGGPGYTIRSEWNRKPYTKGTIGMAHSGKDTGGSQFFIAETALPHLDGRYTAFGQVITGMRLVDRIEVGDSIRTIDIITSADQK